MVKPELEIVEANKVVSRCSLLRHIEMMRYETPGEYLIRLMNMESTPTMARVDIAKALMPYVHGRISQATGDEGKPEYVHPTMPHKEELAIDFADESKRILSLKGLCREARDAKMLEINNSAKSL